MQTMVARYRGVDGKAIGKGSGMHCWERGLQLARIQQHLDFGVLKGLDSICQ